MVGPNHSILIVADLNALRLKELIKPALGILNGPVAVNAGRQIHVLGILHLLPLFHAVHVGEVVPALFLHY